MTNDLLLIILKFAGITVAGVLGVLGTLTETHEIYDDAKDSTVKRRRLNRWGKWALSFTLLGACVALSSQVIEVVKAETAAAEEAKHAREVLDRLETQGRLATESLQELERLITHFSRMRVTIKIELPSDSTYATAFLADVLEAVEQEDISHRWIKTVDEWRPSMGELSECKLTELVFELPQGEEPASGSPSILTNTSTRTLRDLLHSATISLHINHTSNPLNQPSPADSVNSIEHDLTMSKHTIPETIILTVNLKARTINAELQGMIYPPEAWTSTRKIVAISDLGNAHLRVELGENWKFTDVPPFLPKSTLKSASIWFDEHVVQLSNFNQHSPYKQFYDTSLPDVTQILRQVD